MSWLKGIFFAIACLIDFYGKGKHPAVLYNYLYPIRCNREVIIHPKYRHRWIISTNDFLQAGESISHDVVAFRFLKKKTTNIHFQQL